MIEMYVHPPTYRCGRSDIAYLYIQSIRDITLLKSNHGTICWFNAVAIVKILCLEEGSDCYLVHQSVNDMARDIHEFLLFWLYVN